LTPRLRANSIGVRLVPSLLSDTEAKQLKLEPYDIASDAFKIIANSQGEYLLLQNIRNEGWYKEAMGYGMLVWRIDYDDLPSVNLGDNPNNTTGKPRVMIVPADRMVYNSYQQIRIGAKTPQKGSLLLFLSVGS
jgi:immune inhibitor A